MSEGTASQKQRRMTRSLALARTFACAAAFGLLAATDDPSPGAGTPPPVVRLESGMLSGTREAEVTAFQGIPYAAPPVGELRWRPPAAAPPWAGIRSADDYGASCPQARPPARVPAGSRGATTDEDCLTLNVWTLGARAGVRPMPVMVWLHGGGNGSGTGADRYVAGGAFARDGVVLVTLNYRLGLFGFFAHPAIVGEARGEPTGNFGLLDQLAALRWVRANIAAFGGDPQNVTLFGESAGGEDAVTLAASSAAAGLFERVIAESPGDLFGAWPTLAQAQTRSIKAVAPLGLGEQATAAQLRALPASALAGVSDDALLGPIVDKGVVAEPPAANGLRTLRVPLIVGSNAGDGDQLGGDASPGSLFPRLSAADLAFVRARYAARGIASDSAVARQLFGDGFFAAPARYAAERATVAGRAAYVYRFEYVLEALAYRRPEATHGSEIPFVFENWPPLEISDADRAVGAALHGCWIAFATTGTPACAGPDPWPAYDTGSRRIMRFGAHPSVGPSGDDDVLQRLEERLTNP